MSRRLFYRSTVRRVVLLECARVLVIFSTLVEFRLAHCLSTMLFARCLLLTVGRWISLHGLVLSVPLCYVLGDLNDACITLVLVARRGRTFFVQYTAILHPDDFKTGSGPQIELCRETAFVL